MKIKKVGYQRKVIFLKREGKVDGEEIIQLEEKGDGKKRKLDGRTGQA